MDLQPNKTDVIYLPITNNRISASEWNQLVGSCMAFITAAGLTPDASDNEQFLNAFKTIAADLELVGANTNLSNLTAAGQAKFDGKADTDLSNVTNTGKSTAAGLAMPSNTYIDLTLGSSGSRYTAPSNGYFTIRASGTSADTTVNVINETSGGVCSGWTTGNGGQPTVHAFVPALKGQSILLEHANLITIYWFRFVYAEGSKSEAN